jgi:hypothetical protein
LVAADEALDELDRRELGRKREEVHRRRPGYAAATSRASASTESGDPDARSTS